MLNMISITSVGVSEYSFTLSTDTMFVSMSEVVLTIQFKVAVTWENKKSQQLIQIHSSNLDLSRDNWQSHPGDLSVKIDIPDPDQVNQSV